MAAPEEATTSSGMAVMKKNNKKNRENEIQHKIDFLSTLY